MVKIVRAVDVGYGHTKFVRAVKGREIVCESFASLAYPSARDLSGPERRTVALPINGMFYEVGPDVVDGGANPPLFGDEDAVLISSA